MVIALLLFSLLLYVSVAIAAGMLIAGLRFLVRGHRSTARHQGWQLLGAALLLSPSTYFFYLLEPHPVDDAVRTFRLSRACRRHAETALPEAPVTSHGIELITDAKAHRGFQDNEVVDLAQNPFLYLGAKGNSGFQFVEYQGRRYVGTSESYAMIPYTEPTATYRIFVSVVPGVPTRFQLTLSERESHRRIGSVTGFGTYNKRCPTYDETKKLLQRMIQPSPVLPNHRQPPLGRLSARVILRRVNDERPVLNLRLDHRLQQTCAILRPDPNLEWANRLEFKVDENTTLSIPFQEAPWSREIVGLFCTPDEILTFLRGVHTTQEKAYFLYRHSTGGALLSQHEIVQTSGASIDHAPFPRRRGEMMIRHIALKDNEVIFELVRAWSDSRTFTRREISLGWYALSLSNP